MSRSADSCAKSFELGDDRIGGDGPHERPAVLVVVSDEVIDFRGQVIDRSERASADRLVGDDREESLNLVELGRVGGDECRCQC